ncbi:Hypothetical protein FKW44_011315 [Caligus rogercresseyi]|uniref:Uncharacterized protein n=1 Tax=Caligus rogercresseyi TaxID=217165 RepID=A0A7T8HI44_CALRO|nr:Hypothetical protein FKW44_011315 [Caligus rogercresseyi]
MEDAKHDLESRNQTIPTKEPSTGSSGEPHHSRDIFTTPAQTPGTESVFQLLGHFNLLHKSDSRSSGSATPKCGLGK